MSHYLRTNQRPVEKAWGIRLKPAPPGVTDQPGKGKGAQQIVVRLRAQRSEDADVDAAPGGRPERVQQFAGGKEEGRRDPDAAARPAAGG